MRNEPPQTDPKGVAPPRNSAKSARGSLPQEPVERRKNVGMVTPADYPMAERRDADVTGNRGTRPKPRSGAARGSGAGAGGGGSREDYDDDPQGGGGAVNLSRPSPRRQARSEKQQRGT